MKGLKTLLMLVILVLMAGCGGTETYTRPSTSLSTTKEGCVRILLEGAARGFEVQYADVDWLSNGKTREYHWVKRSGVTFGDFATVFDKSADVDLYIYDENNNEICKDEKVAPYAVCIHTPAWTGDFLTRLKMYRGSGYYCYGIFSD